MPPLLAPHVQKLSVIDSARVPVLKFCLCGIDIDLVFVAVALPQPPTDAEVLDTVATLPLVAPECRLSFNGIRTVLQLRRIVAATGVRHDAYATALKAVKLWAKAQHLYGMNYGYPGGVGYGVLVARACQFLAVHQQRNASATGSPPPPPPPRSSDATPQDESSSSLAAAAAATPATAPPPLTALTVFRMFFEFLNAWMRDPTRVHTIYVTENLDPHPDAPRFAGMPETFGSSGNDFVGPLVVLNPAYPYVNTCYGVGHSGVAWLRREVARAQATLQAHAAQRAPWAHLMDRPSDFARHFAAHAQWVLVEVPHKPIAPATARRAGVDAEALAEVGARDGEVDGFVEAKLKFLLYELESAGVDVRVVPARLTHSTRTSGSSLDTLFLVACRGGASTEALTGLVDRALRVFRVSLTVGHEWPMYVPPRADVRRYDNPLVKALLAACNINASPLQPNRKKPRTE